MFSKIPSLTMWAQECGIQLSASYLLLFSNDLAKKPQTGRLSGHVGSKFYKFLLQMVLRITIRGLAILPRVSLWWHMSKPGGRCSLPSNFGHLKPQCLKQHYALL